MNRRTFLRAAAAAAVAIPLAPLIPARVNTPLNTRLYRPKCVYRRIVVDRSAPRHSLFLRHFQREVDALVAEMRAETDRLGLVAVTDPEWMDRDGQILAALPHRDAYEATLYWYAEPV